MARWLRLLRWFGLAAPVHEGPFYWGGRVADPTHAINYSQLVRGFGFSTLTLSAALPEGLFEFVNTTRLWSDWRWVDG